MYIVYVLKSSSHNIHYVGFSLNLERRLKEHNTGQSTFTAKYSPWEVIYTEQVPTRSAARLREKYLKTAAGRRFIAKMVEAKK